MSISGNEQEKYLALKLQEDASNATMANIREEKVLSFLKESPAWNGGSYRPVNPKDIPTGPNNMVPTDVEARF